MGLNISLQYGSLTLMQSSIVFKARNTVKQSWMIFNCLPHQRILISQNRKTYEKHDQRVV